MSMEVFLILLIGIFAGFYVQTVVGFAGSLVALPILLFKMPLPDAIAYISIFYIFSCTLLLIKEWRNIDYKIIWQLSYTTIAGVLLGVFVLSATQPIVLKMSLGIFIILYVVYEVLGKRKPQLTKWGFLSLVFLRDFSRVYFQRVVRFTWFVWKAL